MVTALRSRVQDTLRRLASEHATTPRLSAAIGVGAFVGSTPLFGLHTLIGLALSRALRLNAVAVTLGTQVSLPFLAPLLALASVELGHRLLTGAWLDLPRQGLDLEVARTYLSAWLLGSVLVGASLGGALGGLAYAALGALRRGAPAHPWTGKSRGFGLGYALFFLVIRALGRRGGYALLVPVIAFYFLFDVKGRRESRRYLRRVLGPRTLWQRQGDTWRHFSALGRSLVDRLLVMARGKAAFEYGSRDFHHLQGALTEGAGVILLSGHFGSWSIAGTNLQGYARPNLVVYDNEAEGIRRFFAKHGGPAQPRIIVQSQGPTSSMEILRALRSNEVVAMLADRVAPGGASVPVTFFGATARLPAGPFQLAALSGAPVILTFGHKFVMLPARRFTSARRGDRDALVAEGAQWFADALEAAVRAHPYQWFNFFPFWPDEAEA